MKMEKESTGDDTIWLLAISDTQDWPPYAAFRTKKDALELAGQIVLREEAEARDEARATLLETSPIVLTIMEEALRALDIHGTYTDYEITLELFELPLKGGIYGKAS